MKFKSGFWVAGLASLMLAQDSGRTLMNSPYFTGPVYSVKENATGTNVHIYFPAGSRTKWHSHEFGQVILCEEGTCINAIKGGPVILMHAGDTSYAPPGVMHWQGAPADAGGTQFNTHRGQITWADPVTDEEYRAPTSRISIVGPKK